MNKLASLEKQRKTVAAEISSIASMRKGVLNEQYSPFTKKDGTQSMRGPYYVLTYKGPRGKTISKAIPLKDAAYIRRETEAYKRFRQLCERYTEICGQISRIGDGGGNNGDRQDTRV